MSEVALTIQTLAPTGITPSYTGSLSTENTYQVRNDGKTFLHVKKSAAVDCVVTIDTPGTVGGLAIAQQTVTVVATTGDKMIGPFAPSIYNDSLGDVTVSFSDVDGLTIAAVRL